MTWQTVPWMVGGGAEHSAELARALAYSQAGGGEGVGSGLDCKAQQNTVADNRVRIGPGVVTMLNRYGGGARQAYVGYNPTDEQVTVPATTSSGARSDLVVARVVDPQYSGTTPTTVAAGPYMFSEVIANVPATTTKFSQLGLAYPAVEICRIDRPANTNTVSNGQIVDLRKLTRPRTSKYTARHVAVNGASYPTNSEFFLSHNDTGWKNWWTFNNIPVPEWAGRMVLTCPITSMGFAGGYFYGEFLAMMGAAGTIIDSSTVVADINNTNSAYGDLVNADLLIADDFTVPAQWRGIDIFTIVKGRSLANYTAGDAMTWRSTAVRLEIEFFETIG